MATERVKQLIGKMTLRQKLAQMTQLDASLLTRQAEAMETGPEQELCLQPGDIEAVGSVLNTLGLEKNKALQQQHLQKDPNGIPLLFMLDIIHGLRTVYPIPLGLGCSFDTDMMRRISRVAAVEGSGEGIHVTFSPMGDLVRDPRWGRVMESTGEDPWLNAQMCRAAVEGYGRPPFAQPGEFVSCVKHFAGYGAGEGGREYNTVDISRGMLVEYYLSAYKAAIDAGARMVMTAFNTIERIPATGNRWLLREVLRQEWGFEGVVITDFNSLNELVLHGVAENGKQAAYMGLMAGVDIEMMSTHYLTYGEQLVEEGLVPAAYIDEAVERILTLKEELGLFDTPFKLWDAAAALGQEAAEHSELARQAAVKSCVLLKNEGVLPLSGQEKIGLVGPFADTKKILGGWSLPNDPATVSLKQGFLRYCGSDRLISAMEEPLEPTWGERADLEGDLELMLRQVEACNVVVAAVGEPQGDTGECASKGFLRLSAKQEQLLQELHCAGKKVVMVVFSGRPLEIGPVLPYCDAVVQAWFPGVQGGNAIADLLFGKENFSGRLSMTFHAALARFQSIIMTLTPGARRTKPTPTWCLSPAIGTSPMPRCILLGMAKAMQSSGMGRWRFLRISARCG